MVLTSEDNEYSPVREQLATGGTDTKFKKKGFLSKPGGHFLEARRAFFCPRAAGVRIPALDQMTNSVV